MKKAFLLQICFLSFIDNLNLESDGDEGVYVSEVSNTKYRQTIPETQSTTQYSLADSKTAAQQTHSGDTLATQLSQAVSKHTSALSLLKY